MPEIVVLTAALAVLLLDLFVKEEWKRYLGYLSAGSLGLAAVLSAGLIGERVSVLGDMFVIDSFGIVLKVIIVISAAVAIFAAVDFLNFPRSRQGEYYSLVMLSVLGMMTVTGSSNLISIFLGIQLTSIPLYILAGFNKEDVKSNEAALKYFLLGILTAAVTLYGMSLLYGLTGTLHLATMADKLRSIDLNDPVLFIGMTFVVSGFTFKIAAVPFHFWAPDTYEGAPTPVTALIAAVPKIAGFAALVRLVSTAFPGFTVQWIGFFSLVATLTMFLGNVSAIPQHNIKRMLAFSGIAHAGYMLIALAVLNEQSVSGLVFYLIAYSTMNLGAFAVVIGLGRTSPEHQIEDFAGLGSRSPVLAGAMTVFMLSMLGFPGTAGFAAKLLVFGSAIQRGYVWLALIGVINSVISVYYYFGVVRQMYFVEPRTAAPLKITATLVGVIGLALLVTFVLGLYPEPFISLTRSVSIIHMSPALK